MSTITTTIKLRPVQKTPVFNLRHALAECDNSFVLRHDDVTIAIARIETASTAQNGYIIVSFYEGQATILQGKPSIVNHIFYEDDGDTMFEAYCCLRERYTDAQLRRMYDHASMEEGN